MKTPLLLLITFLSPFISSQEDTEVLCPTLKCVPDLGANICYEHEHKQPVDLIKGAKCRRGGCNFDR